MDTPVLNVDLLDRVVDYAAEHAAGRLGDLGPDIPDGVAWIQHTWRYLFDLDGDPVDDCVSTSVAADGTVVASRPDVCGTAMCVAGITATLEGGIWLDALDLPEALLYHPRDEELRRLLYTHEIPRERVVDATAARALDLPVGSVVRVTPVRVRAQVLLGLTDEEAALLFDGGYDTVDELRRRADRIRAGALRDASVTR